MNRTRAPCHLRHSAVHVTVAWVACAAASAPAALGLRPVATYHTGLFGQSAAEIAAFCPQTGRIFVVNARSASIDVLALPAGGALERVGQIRVAADVPGIGAVNSVAVCGGTVAAAAEAVTTGDDGVVAFYDAASLGFAGAAVVGAGPDMLTFSPDGRLVLVANEGEPNADCTIDREGSVSVIDISQGVDRAVVDELDFRDWNADGARAAELPDLLARGMRHFGRVRCVDGWRAATVAEDLEPEWITVTADGLTAYVSLQEANAVAELDLTVPAVTRIIPLGFKDLGLARNALDTSDRDGGPRIVARPGLLATYQPDTIRCHEADGRRWLVMANEGDARVRPLDDDQVPGVAAGESVSDEARLADWPTGGGPFAARGTDADLGRLALVRDLVGRHLDAAGRPTRLFTFGGRSFAILDLATGGVVFDSGADFERITADRLPAGFNASNDSLGADRRSRSKGPEPEGLALGTVAGRTYAFIGLERTGGIMVYDITNPTAAAFVGYHTNRRFDLPMQTADGAANPAAGDSGIEGVTFVEAAVSPTGRPLVIAANETSGTTTVWEVTTDDAPPERSADRLHQRDAGGESVEE